jgi:type II secretory pathway predicted ATPase ExeA
MFLEHWKLKEQPFGVTPDPRYLYFSQGHREALATLFYGIETGRGFLSLIAPPGMGKTTLLFQLLQRWKGYVHSAFLFQTQCNSRELIRYLLEDLRIRNDGDDIVRMHAELNEFLFRETKAGRRVVIFIDEAQNLADSVLETVRLLSNFEAPEKKLLQIVLAGQPELAQRLSHPGLAQLRQRIAIQARLDPLPPSEIRQYIDHRLQVAGYEGPELFSPEALDLVGNLSQGVPRLINILCFNALTLGFALKRQQINSEIVREAAKDLTLDSHRPFAGIPHSQAAPQLVPRKRWSWRELWPGIKSRITGRRLVQTSAMCLMLGSVGIYVAGRTRSAATYLPNQNRPVATHTSGSLVRVAAPAPPNRKASVALPASESPRTNSDPTVEDSFAYVVQPHDTIRDLCLSTFGRYDNKILARIRQLNPGLKNPNQVEVGQEIRLPLSP